MKTTLLSAFILLLNSISFAQSGFSLLASATSAGKVSAMFACQAAPYRMEAAPPGYRMRKIGGTLTLAGFFFVIGGSIVHNGGGSTGPSTTYNSQNSSSKGIGVLMIATGATAIVPGVILWASGARRYRQFEAQENNSFARLHLTGNSLALRF